MEKKEELLSSHEELIKRMQQLGYKNQKGICFGLTHMAMQAYLLGEKAFCDFVARINFINSIPVSTFNEWINKNKKGREEIVADILALFNGIELYHQGSSYPHLFDTKLTSQGDVTPIIKQVQPLAFQKNPIVKIASFCGIYTYNELNHYLESLKSIPTEKGAVVFILKGPTHTIMIGLFDNTWLLMDSNQWPPEFIKDSDELTLALMDSLLEIDTEISTQDVVAFNTTIFTTTANETDLNLFIGQWQSQNEQVMHEILVKKAPLVTSDGFNFFYIAAQNGHINTLNALLKIGGFDINQIMPNGSTPLFIAAQHGDLKVVQTILKAEALNINQIMPHGATPLFIAAQNGDLEVVNALLAVPNIDINQTMPNGYTPLSIAITMGHVEIVHALLEKGALPNKTDGDGRTPLYIAVQNGSINTVTQLLEIGADVNAAFPKDETTPLFVAALNGHRVLVELLLSKQAQVNKATKDGVTPLYVAAQNGHVEIVNLLLLNHADANQVRTDNGAGPLFIASQNGHLQIVTALLEKNAHINQATRDDGTTPLIIAAQEGHKEIVEALLVKGANVEQADSEGFTPLYIAALENHPEVVSLLLNAQGFSPETKTTEGTLLCSVIMASPLKGMKALNQLLETTKKQSHPELPNKGSFFYHESSSKDDNSPLEKEGPDKKKPI